MKHKNKILISNLQEEVEEKDLQEMFEEFGEIVSIEISEYLDPVFETCTAVVTMEYKEDAEDAIESVHGKRWRGLRLELDVYEEEKSRTVYDDEDDQWSVPNKDGKKVILKRPPQS